MAFKHKSAVFKTVQIENPFREGQDKAYADILLDKIREMRWWRGIVGIGVLVIFAATLVLFYISVNQQKTVPVLINVMPSGEAQFIGEVRQTGTVQVPEAAIIYQIRKYVTYLRSISLDPEVLYNNIEECYAMVTTNYEPTMTKNLRANSPFELVGKVRRNVMIETIIKTTSNSYQIDWGETTIGSAASSSTTTAYRGIVTIVLLPTTDTTIRNNPLGIYIDNFESTVR